MKTKTPTKARRKTNPAAKALGKAILSDLTEFAEALEAGVALDSKYTIRTVEVPDPPALYSAGDVCATRDKVGVSQSVLRTCLAFRPSLCKRGSRAIACLPPGPDGCLMRSITIPGDGAEC